MRHLVCVCLHEGRTGRGAGDIVTTGGMSRQPVDIAEAPAEMDEQHNAATGNGAEPFLRPRELTEPSPGTQPQEPELYRRWGQVDGSEVIKGLPANTVWPVRAVIRSLFISPAVPLVTRKGVYTKSQEEFPTQLGMPHTRLFLLPTVHAGDSPENSRDDSALQRRTFC
jgi:hypothetical protein